MQIVISSILATAISFIIINFGDDIQEKIEDAVDDFKEWLSEKHK